MFDPFGDFASAGYLRNLEGLNDPDDIKVQEHLFFEANLETAVKYLASRKKAIEYKDFLKVHQILFDEFYPWAGKDRAMLGVGRFVGKGDQVKFEASERIRMAVDWGLEMGNNIKTIAQKPGTVMGAFAWAHPFLDGNGRTMILVHRELCARAGFSINWGASAKGAYLQALTDELKSPDQGILDAYMLPLVQKSEGTNEWLQSVAAIPGLDGQGGSVENEAYAADDADALERYEEFRRARDGAPNR